MGNKLLGLVGGAKARHLLKDLRLAERSSRAVEGVWKGLEETRGRLWEYSLHVGQFKVCFSTYYLPPASFFFPSHRRSIALCLFILPPSP